MYLPVLSIQIKEFHSPCSDGIWPGSQDDNKVKFLNFAIFSYLNGQIALVRAISLVTITLQELKLQGLKICDGVVFSRYSRAQCFAINLSDVGQLPKWLFSPIGRALYL